MDSEKYIGLDFHQATIVVAVMRMRKKPRISRSIFPRTVKNIRLFLDIFFHRMSGMAIKRQLTFCARYNRWGDTQFESILRSSTDGMLVITTTSAPRSASVFGEPTRSSCGDTKTTR
jgi:hypothetical protein